MRRCRARESEESRAGREKAEEPEAREVGLPAVLENVDLPVLVLVDGRFVFGVFLTEEADGRGGLNGFGGIFEGI